MKSRRVLLLLLVLAFGAVAGAVAYRLAHRPGDLPRWLEPGENYPRPDTGVG